MKRFPKRRRHYILKAPGMRRSDPGFIKAQVKRGAKQRPHKAAARR